MSKLNTTTSTNPPTPTGVGDMFFETDTNNILIWDGSNFQTYESDGVSETVYNSYSLDFDGVGDYGSTNYIPSDSTAFSYSFWTKSSDTTNNMAWLATSPSSGNGGGFRVITPSNTRAFYVLVANGSAQYLNNNAGGQDASLAIRDGNWHHVVFTINGTAVKIWIDGGSNGSPNYTDTSTISYVGNVTQPLIFGKNGEHDSYYFNGELDEIATFEYELNAAQISNIYNGGQPVDVGSNGLNLSPSGYWRCGDSDGGTGSTVSDISGNGNDITLSGNASIKALGSGDSIYTTAPTTPTPTSTPTVEATPTPTPTPITLTPEQYPNKVYVKNLGTYNEPLREGEYTLQSSPKYFMPFAGSFDYYKNSNGWQLVLEVGGMYHQFVTPTDSGTDNIISSDFSLFYDEGADWFNAIKVCRNQNDCT